MDHYAIGKSSSTIACLPVTPFESWANARLTPSSSSTNIVEVSAVNASGALPLPPCAIRKCSCREGTKRATQYDPIKHRTPAGGPLTVERIDGGKLRARWTWDDAVRGPSPRGGAGSAGRSAPIGDPRKAKTPAASRSA
jgi:hypothetical protein